MGGKDEHLGYLYMSRRIGGKDGHVGDVVAGKWLDALINTGGTVGVAMEAYVAEVCLDQSGLEVRDTDGSIGYVDT